MPPKRNQKKANGKTSGITKRKGKKDEGPTPITTIRVIERMLRSENVKPNPLPAGAKRDQFADTRRMKRLRNLPILRYLNPKDDTLLRNDRPSYMEANSGYMRGNDGHAPCEQCQNGDGAQHGCIVLPGEWGGACTNCSYDADAKKCEFWRPKQGKKGGKKGGMAKKGATAKEKGGKKGKTADSEEEDEDDQMEETDDEDEGLPDGTPFWGPPGERDDDDAAGGDDGDAGALFVPHQIVAY